MARILCIDDELEMLNLQKMILLQAGHEVETAADARSAYDLVLSWQPDVILLDLMLLDIEGWSFYQYLRRDDSTPYIPVIVVTARAQATERTMALQIQQVDDYITKPFAPQQLSDAVARVLDKKTRG
jgi:DNA-binding response OmpR family regulator